MKYAKYSLTASLIVLILVSLSFSVFAVDAEMEIADQDITADAIYGLQYEGSQDSAEITATQGILAASAEVSIHKITGTTIVIPQIVDGTRITITGAALETTDWTVLRGLNSATFHLVISGNTTSIPANALQNNTRILSIVADNVTTIGANAFSGAGNVAGSSLSLPALTTIPNGTFTAPGMFAGNRFRHISIPNVTAIGNWAFFSRTDLVTIATPRVQSIGEGAFHGATALRVIELANTPPTFGTNVFSGITNPLIVGTPNAASGYNLTIAPWPAGTIGLPTRAVNRVPFAVNENVTIIPNISYDFTPVSWQKLAANGSWVNTGQTGASFTIARALMSDAGLYRFNFSIGSLNYSLFYRLEIDPDAPPYLGTPVVGVNLNRASATITIGDTETLTATVLPLYAANRSVIWSSSDENVATVNSSGMVTAVATGTAVITVTTVDGGFQDSCIITVTPQPVLVTGVSLDETSATVTVGSTTTLTATVAPTNATNRDVAWSSSDESVAAVDAYGVVTAVATGTAVITVTTVDGGFQASCTVTVTSQPTLVTGVSLSRTSATTTVGRTETLTATIYPADASNHSVTWSSSDESVATVDAYGVVTALAAGTATITVTTVDGGFQDSCTITVGEAMLLSSITKTVSAYTTFNIVCSFTNITLSDSATFAIGYDPTQVELVNFAAQTHGLHITVGLVAGTSLEILYHNTATGELVFKVHSANPLGQPWSGVVTVLRFEAKVTGYTTIYIEQLTA